MFPRISTLTKHPFNVYNQRYGNYVIHNLEIKVSISPGIRTFTFYNRSTRVSPWSNKITILKFSTDGITKGNTIGAREQNPKAGIFRDKSGLQCLLNCINSERSVVIPVMITMLISSAVISAFPMVLGQLVNNFTVETATNLPSLNKGILLILLASLSSFAKSALSLFLCDRIIVRFRMDLFSNLLKKNANFFDTNPPSTFSSIVSGNIVTASTITNHITQFLRSGITCITGTALTLSLAPASLFLSTIFPVLISLGIIIPCSKRIQHQVTDRYRRMLSLIEYSDERLANIKFVKSFNAEAYEINKFQKEITAIGTVSRKIALASGITNGTAVAAVGSLILLVTYNCTKLVLSDIMKIGDVTSILMYSLLIGGSVQSMVRSLSDAQRSIGAANTIMQYLDNDQMERLNKLEIKSITAPAIGFKGVSFSYPSRPSITTLYNISFSLPPKKNLVILGPTGCGKSTIIELILGFYKPTAGNIYIDGYDSYDNNLRSLMSYVEQKGILFNDTLRANVKYTEDDDSVNDELLKSYKAANLDVFINTLENGDLTNVGRSGTSISGGQRQKVAIARGLYKKCKLILLDEPTSSLDMKSEDYIINSLKDILKEYTAIITTHRINVVTLADYIMVMDEGCIRQFGTKDEVMNDPCELLKKLLAKTTL